MDNHNASIRYLSRTLLRVTRALWSVSALSFFLFPGPFPETRNRTWRVWRDLRHCSQTPETLAPNPSSLRPSKRSLLLLLHVASPLESPIVFHHASPASRIGTSPLSRPP